MAQKQVALKITVDGKELDLAKTSVEQFDKAYSAAAQKLSTMKVGSDEWNKLNSELQSSKKAFDDTKNAANGADGKFKSLRSQIRETTVALQALADEGKQGSSEFKALSDKLDDLGDAQKRVAFQSGQFEDKVAALPGPIGKLGQGVKGLKESFDTFGKGLTISLGIVGLLVTAFFAIKEALGKTKEGTELLSKATTAFNKVLAPLFAILEKIGTIVLPIVIKGFEMLGSVVGKVAEFFGVKTEKVDEVTASLEKNNEAANKLAEEEKARADKEKERVDQLNKLQEERTRKLKEESDKRKVITDAAEKVMNDARLALMEEKDREIEVATQKHKENLKALRAAGNRGIKLEEERYNLELFKINEKYQKMILEQDKTFIARLVGIQNEQYDLNIQRNKLSLESTKNNNLATLTNELSFFEQIKSVEEEKLEFNQDVKARELKDSQDAQMEALKNAKASADKIKKTEQQFALETLAQKNNFEDQKLILEKEKSMEKLAIIKRYADEGKKIEFDTIQQTINELDRLSAARNFDYEEDVQRNILKIEELKKQQAIEEEMAKGQADVLFRIKRDYGDKINAIEVENTKIKFAEEQQRYQIAVIYANAAAQVGQILQQLAGERKELALLGLAIEKAAALTSIAINAKKNFIADGGIKSPLAWANLAAAAVQAAAVVVTYVKGVQSIKSAGTGSVSSSGAGGTGRTGGSEEYNGLGRNYEDGGMINGPRHAQGGVMIEAEGGEAVMTRGAVTAFGPLLSALNVAGGGTSFNNAITSGGPLQDNPKVANVNTEQNPMVIKTFVVSTDMTSEQEKQARLKDLSTL